MSALIIREFNVTPTNPGIGEDVQVDIVVEHTDANGSTVDYTIDLFVDSDKHTTFTGDIQPALKGESVDTRSATLSFQSEEAVHISYDFTASDGSEDSDSTRILVGLTQQEFEEELQQTFTDNRTRVRFENISAPESPLVTGELPATLELKYGQPNISIDTSARYQTHETIGGPTIRQKVGTDPVNISVDGVCTLEEANAIDALRFEQVVFLDSNRIATRCQVASTSTEPMDDGGAIDMDGQFTHNFNISLVSVQ